jgi:hypothetical protein
LEQAIRRILGIDLKMKQYEQGAIRPGCRGSGGHGYLQQGLGIAGGPPSRAEIASPRAWLERVDGSSAAAG